MEDAPEMAVGLQADLVGFGVFRGRYAGAHVQPPAEPGPVVVPPAGIRFTMRGYGFRRAQRWPRGDLRIHVRQADVSDVRSQIFQKTNRPSDSLHELLVDALRGILLVEAEADFCQPVDEAFEHIRDRIR